MNKLTLPLLLFVSLFNSNISFSQSWLPEPVKSPYADALTGTWTSSPYEFMGSTNNDVITYTKILNGQFMEIDVKRTDNTGFTYEGKEIIAPAADGKMKGTYYDMFGHERSTSYTGSKDGDKFIINGASLVGTGTREIIIEGDNMIQNVTFSIPDKSGNTMPEQKITITYKKTN
jgi:hypothetical protein